MRQKPLIQGDDYVPPSFAIEWDTKLVAEGFPWEDFSGFSRLEGPERKSPSRKNGIPLKERYDHAEMRVRAAQEANPENGAELILVLPSLVAIVKTNSDKCEYFSYVTQHYLEDRSLQEIAKENKISKATVQYRIDSVLKFIRSELFKTK